MWGLGAIRSGAKGLVAQGAGAVKHGVSAGAKLLENLDEVNIEIEPCCVTEPPLLDLILPGFSLFQLDKISHVLHQKERSRKSLSHTRDPLLRKQDGTSRNRQRSSRREK